MLTESLHQTTPNVQCSPSHCTRQHQMSNVHRVTVPDNNTCPMSTTSQSKVSTVSAVVCELPAVRLPGGILYVPRDHHCVSCWFVSCLLFVNFQLFACPEGDSCRVSRAVPLPPSHSCEGRRSGTWGRRHQGLGAHQAQSDAAHRTAECRCARAPE